MLAFGLLASLAAWWVTARWEDARRMAVFREGAEEYARALDMEFRSLVADVESVADFYGASVTVSAEEFARFTRPLLRRNPTLQAIQWLPRVPESDRVAFEARARRDGLDGFAIREQSVEGLRPAGRRADYFPAFWVEPLSSNAAALGFDAGSEPQRRASLEKALASGLPAATPPVTLVQEIADQRGLIIFVPQSPADAAQDTQSEWRQGVPGLAAGAIRVGDLTEKVLAKLPPHGIDLLLRDAALDAASGQLYVRPSPTRGSGPMPDTAVFFSDPRAYTARIPVADRILELRAVPSPGAYPANAWPTLLLGSGLAMTLISATLIAQRRRLAMQLREREELFRLFIEHAPAALAMLDGELRYLAVSRRWQEDFGLGDRDLIGQSHYEIFPDVPASWQEAHLRGLAGEVIRAEADPFARQDGPVKWLRWEVRPWHRSDGTVGGIGIFSEDISERKQAELELRRYQQIVETSSEMLVFFDRDLRFQVVNPAYAALRQTTPEQLQGRLVHEVVGEETYAEIAPHLESALAGQAQRFSLRLPGADGRFRYLDVEQQPFRGPDGAVLGVVVGFHDLTEVREAQIALEDQQARLAELVAARTAELLASEAKLRTIYDLLSMATRTAPLSATKIDPPGDPDQRQFPIFCFSR